MLLSVLAFAVVQDPLAKTLTFPATIGSASKVVEALAKASGAPLKAGNVVEAQIIGVASPERPLKDIMDAVAKATEAEWKKEGEVYVLTRSNGLEDQRKARDRQGRLSMMRKSLEKLSKIPNAGSFSDEEAKKLYKDQQEAQKLLESNPQEWSRRYRAMQGRAPMERLVRKMAGQLKAEDLIDIVPGQRIVVATNPTAMQVRFPVDPTALINQFIVEQRVWSEVTRPEGQEGSISYFGGPTNKIEKVGKVLMVVNRSESWGDGGVVIHVKVMDEKGRLAGEGQESFGGIFADQDPNEFLKPAKPEEGDEIIEGDSVTNSFVKYVRAMNASQGREAAAPEDVQAFLRRPDQNEPLSIGTRAAMTLVATKKNQIIAGVLPDAAFASMIFGAGDGTKVPLSRWYKTLEMMGVEKLGDEKTVILRPEAPIQVETARTDRKSLAKLVDRFDKEGRVSLDAAAEFIAANRIDGMTLAMMYVFFLRMEGLAAAYNPNMVQFVRLYASLNNNQREVLKRGGSLTLSQLDPGQRDLLKRIVYWSDTRYGPAMMEEEIEAPEPDETGETNMSPFGDWGSLKREPTERFPGGLPSEMTVSATVTEKAAYFRSGEESFYMGGPIEENQLAWDMFQRERMDLFPYAKDMAQIKEVRQGKAISWDFRILLEPKFSLGQVLRDDVIGKEKISIKNLPKEFMEKIDKQIKEYREAYKDAKPGDFGGPSRGNVIPPVR